MSDASEAQGGRDASGSGRGWTDAPYTEATRDALVQKIGEQQRRVASAAGSGLGGRVDRGQHQKLLLGAPGTLRVLDQVPAAVKLGPFATPFALPVACRFSNGQPCPFSDKNADVRGVALKFFSPQGTETDVLATNEGGRSHASDAESFMAFADILVAKIERGATGAFEELLKELREGELTAGEVAHIGAVLLKEVGLHSVRSLTLESYWGSVVKLGDAALKYSLRPHKETPASVESDGGGPDYLRHELLSRLAKGPVKWQLCVQLYVDEESTPVNDAAKVWNSASVVIGELEISSIPSEDDERKINQMAFNPGNGFDPLGITHARADVYAASARNRADRGLLSAKDAREYLATRR
jgi:catalase